MSRRHNKNYEALANQCTPLFFSLPHPEKDHCRDAAQNGISSTKGERPNFLKLLALGILRARASVIKVDEAQPKLTN